MKNKIVFVLALVIIVLAALSIFLYWQNTKLAVDASQTNTDQTCSLSTNQASGVRMSVVSASQSDSFYNIQAEYPQFDGADPAFNQKIASLINGEIEDFKKEAKDNFDARNATMPAGEAALQNPEQPFDFIATWTPAQFGSRYLSFAMDIYYFSGGAHGTDQIFAFNYDLGNKKEITISDFLGAADNLDKLSNMAQDQVASQLQSNGMEVNDSMAQMIQEGAKPVPENYRNFTFGYGKLTIYFEQYQVAPGSAGTITINFYKNDLEQNAITSKYFGQ
ncbi:MAG: DUF3298 and DUF4163 domain-containing protein [Candidatus Paceibacterota bacterium]|jgi:hypothetical protein